jgi:orotidine-5'-phosphate decarboxylase
MEPRVIVALDFEDRTQVDTLVEQLDPTQCRLKVGKELFTRLGPQVVKDLVAKKFDVFLDLKFHDIPTTTANACCAAADLGVWMMNVHASGGAKMLAAAKHALTARGFNGLLIAVTVLTSMEKRDLLEVGITGDLEQHVIRLASLAKEHGLDGVVCSAMECEMIKARCGSQFKTVTPGIRLASDNSNDQRRVVTPIEALKNGSDYLVIGRSITQSPAPFIKLQEINGAIADYLAGPRQPVIAS